MDKDTVRVRRGTLAATSSRSVTVAARLCVLHSLGTLPASERTLSWQSREDRSWPFPDVVAWRLS